MLEMRWANLLHEHPVVALCRHASMGKPDEVAEPVATEVALPAAALAAGGGGLLEVPGAHGLYGADQHDDLLHDVRGGTAIQRHEAADRDPPAMNGATPQLNRLQQPSLRFMHPRVTIPSP